MKDKEELEKEFKDTFEQHSQEIELKLAAAEKALDEARELSEKHGIPFDTTISYLYNQYVPNSMKQKFPEIDLEFVKEISDIEYFGTSCGDIVYPGWQVSTC